ncbi:hypothetical protein GVW03_24780, partial [Pseudomonas aeruginosa]|nr:hypothetical protein [Pseudomonas aeruginosa]
PPCARHISLPSFEPSSAHAKLLATKSTVDIKSNFFISKDLSMLKIIYSVNTQFIGRLSYQLL